MARYNEILDEGNTSNYTVNQVNKNKFEVYKDNQLAYTLEKKQSNWVCSCIGFQYRHKCKHLDLIRPFLPKRHPRATITDAIKDFIPKLQQITPRVEVVGSYRRGKADSKDIDILMDCSASDFKKVVTILESYPSYEPVMAGDTIIRGFINGIEMDINRLSEKMNYYLALAYRTGPMEHNVVMRSLAKKLNGSLSENELIVNGANIRVTSEKDIYDALGVQYQPPEKRSEKLVFIQRKNVGAYDVVKNGKVVGSAPSRMQSREQNNKLRDLLKAIAPSVSKELMKYTFFNSNTPSRVDVRFTVSEKEEQALGLPFEVRTPDGTVVKCNHLYLKINASIKADNSRARLCDTVKLNNTKYVLYEVVVPLIQAEIDKKMPLPKNEVSKLLSNKILVNGFPNTIDFATVPYPVEGIK